MSSTVQIILSLITLLFLSIFAHIAAPKLPLFSYITSLHLTSELLFFIFLPILIFESAFNMNINIRRIGENIGAISALAFVGLSPSRVIGDCA